MKGKFVIVSVLLALVLALSLVGCMPQGERGVAGSQGLQGAQGIQGEQGPEGPKGDVGPQGEQGEQGKQGERGKRGYEGDKGDRGPRGATGATGAKGEPGPQGEQGEPGQDCDPEILEILQAQIDALKDRLDALEFVPPIIDGVLGVDEWDGCWWFTDNAGNEFFGGYPEFTYYKWNDEQDLYFGVIVNDPTPLENGNDDLWLAFRDAEDNYKEFRKGFTLIPEEMGKYSEEPFPSSYQPLPEGVEFGCSIDESHIYYEWKIPLALLGVSPGDTIKYLTHVREYPKPEGIPSPINYHPEVTTYFTYSDRSQFGDLLIGSD